MSPTLTPTKNQLQAMLGDGFVVNCMIEDYAYDFLNIRKATDAADTGVRIYINKPQEYA